MSRPRALVTGASSGIGAAIARDLGKRGWDVDLTARSEDALKALAAEIEQADATARVLPLDLAEPGAGERAWDWTATPGVPDMVVNNAGLGSYGAMADADWERERASIQVNVLALAEITKRAAGAMAARGSGRILNIASTAAFQPTPTMAVYGATKAFVLSLSSALAEELRGTGVTVTCVCPGATRTGFQDAADMNDAAILKLSTIASAEAVASLAIDRALMGRRVAVPGTLNGLLALAPRALPRGVVTRVGRWMMRSTST